MISPIANSALAQPIAQTTAAPQPPAQLKPLASTGDTVQVSNAAKALLQESLETSAQTAKEASAGDPQAIRLQARHSATRVHTK